MTRRLTTATQRIARAALSHMTNSAMQGKVIEPAKVKRMVERMEGNPAVLDKLTPGEQGVYLLTLIFNNLKPEGSRDDDLHFDDLLER